MNWMKTKWSNVRLRAPFQKQIYSGGHGQKGCRCMQECFFPSSWSIRPLSQVIIRCRSEERYRVSTFFSIRQISNKHVINWLIDEINKSLIIHAGILSHLGCQGQWQLPPTCIQLLQLQCLSLFLFDYQERKFLFDFRKKHVILFSHLCELGALYNTLSRVVATF